MSNVFIVDHSGKPRDPVHPGYARFLLKQGKASVYRRYPFTIILNKAIEQPQVQPLRIKLDPGSKTTGIAIVNDVSGEIVFAAELFHRGHAIKGALDARRAVRRSRRQRKTRYRKARWQNRKRKQGWLPPSLESRIANVLTWVRRLSRSAPIEAISQELVRFDMQLMENPEVKGVEYQQGTLAGYEVRQYLLNKWNHQCAYCGARDIPLQIEHIHPRAHGGTHRISNLTLACDTCNKAKGTKDIQDFLKKKPEVLKRIEAQAKKPLKDAAAVNASRWALFERLKATGLPVEVGSGGLTKCNRTRRGLPKTHWLDAANVGTSTPDHLITIGVVPLLITATGRGNRHMCLPDKHGFPRTSAKGAKRVKGFQTGDIVKAIITKGKKRGTYVGRVAVRSSGYFNIVTTRGTIQGISYHYCHMIHRSDGYSYTKGGAAFPPVA
ncbi:RNA-guided endonuclease IscB [Dictyobacter aurantiacus]|uniref:RNA-guided endonuclease IscB n=1 Tax=Dictyobacter aurantiacus TaxID=1936993 RepID=UPI000F818E96|nr:RNA-guided endonuclease IscB [Dictyobacter aurantiacus]